MNTSLYCITTSEFRDYFTAPVWKKSISEVRIINVLSVIKSSFLFKTCPYDGVFYRFQFFLKFFLFFMFFIVSYRIPYYRSSKSETIPTYLWLNYLKIFLFPYSCSLIHFHHCVCSKYSKFTQQSISFCEILFGSFVIYKTSTLIYSTRHTEDKQYLSCQRP